MGTIFENLKLPLHKWLYAIYLLVTARKGISSLQLSKELDITQKPHGFYCNVFVKLVVILALFYLALLKYMELILVEKNKHDSKRTKGTQGRSTKTKTSVVGMRCREGEVKAQAVKILNSNTINTIVDKHIQKGSVLCTDEARIYSDVGNYSRLVANHSVGEFVNGMASTNGIESVWELLKRGCYGTFHHFSKKYIDRYVNEFTFRLNGGNCKIDTIDRMVNLTLNNTVDKQITYKELVV